MSTDATPSVSDSASAPAPAPDTASTPISTPSTETSTSAPDAPAPPSSAQGDTKESLLSAVLKVVKTDPDADRLKLPGEDGSSPDQVKSEPSEATAPTQEELSDDPSQAEMARYHSRTRKRIDRLLDQRNEARKVAEHFKSAAQTADSLRQFLVQNDIQKQDFEVLIDLGVALRKGDFRTFYAGVRPYVDLAEEALGMRVSDDLAERVRQGHMTTEQARMFSSERIARQLAENQAIRTAQISQGYAQQAHSAAQQGQTEALQRSVAVAVNNWEAGMKQTDPDFAHKQDAVKNFLWSVVQEKGAPASPEAAIEIAKEAYRRANEMVSRFSPRPRATAPVPSSVNRGGNGAVAEPKTLMEAAMLGLQKSRRSA